jgi:hypothetical protein
MAHPVLVVAAWSAVGAAVAPPDSALKVAAVVGVLALVGQLGGSLIVGRQRRADKREDWARQDEVAAKADSVRVKAEAAALLVKATKTQEGKLDDLSAGQAVIHGLVNSNITTLKEEALASSRRELVALSEVVDMLHAQGKEASTEALATLESTRERIAALAEEVTARRAQEAGAA